MSEILRSPLGIYEEHSKEDLIKYASEIYQDLLNHGGNLKKWNYSWFLHIEFAHGVFLPTSRYGHPHFWKRMMIKQEYMEVED